MKLRALDIENFGVFSPYRLEFPGQGLQVVFGANEAGKSTLLQLIRELLFGFQVRNRYAFSDHSGEMAATALIELASGDRVRFRRRKGRQNLVVGEYLDDGRTVDEAELKRLLGGAGPELFQHVFGFSLAELALAEESLKHANLREALYGGALGGLANFQNVFQEIRREHERLFSPSATKRRMNQLMKAIAEKNRQLGAAQLRPRDYQRARKLVAELDSRVRQARAERDSLQRQESRCTRMIQAIELWSRRNALLEQLEQLDVPEGFPLDGAQQYARLKTRHDDLEREQEDFQQELRQVSERLESLSPRADMVTRTAGIRRLEQQLDKIRGFRADLGTRQQESDSIKEGVVSRLRQLDPEWTLEHLDRFRTSIARRAAVEGMQQELDELERRKRELASRQPSLEADIASMQARLRKLADQQVPCRLADLVDTAPSYLANLEKWSQWKEQADAIAVKIETLVTRLNAPFQHQLENLCQLPVPLAATVAEFRARWLQCEQPLRRAQEELQRIEKELKKRSRSLARLHARQQVPDRQQLCDARQKRTRQWQVIRCNFLDAHGTENGSGPSRPAADANPESLADTYETTVQDADRIADQRQQQAEVVARQDQLADQVAELEHQSTLQTDTLHAAQQQQEQCRQQWDALWAPCSLEPEKPDAMLPWLALHEELTEATGQKETIRRRLDDVQREIDQFETALDAAIDDGAGAPTAQLAEARRRVQRAREAASEQKTYETELPGKQHQLETLKNQLAAVEAERDQWQQRWQPLMQQFGFPTSWNVHTATRVLGGLSEARLEFEKAESLDRRIADMRDGVNQFEQQVRKLCHEIAPELESLPTEHAVEELASLLDRARQDQRDQVALRQQQQKLKTRVAAKQDQLSQAIRSLGKLFDAARTDDEATLLDIARRVAQRHQLEEDRQTLEHQLLVVRGEDDPESFAAELQQVDAAALESELRMVRAQLKEADESFDEALREHTLAVDQLRRMDRVSEAASLAMDLESSRSQLRQTIDQWAPLVLAERFMRRAVEQFEREHQPQLLAEVSRLFAQMTLGRYSGITRKLDEQGTLLLQLADGTFKEPSQLSTGTREQLYLAIRLAYVLHYCRDAEPLPVVMDDVLVNFDDQRAAQTIHVLADIAQHLQLILLTCHGRTLEQTTKLVPGLEPIMLGEVPA